MATNYIKSDGNKIEICLEVLFQEDKDGVVVSFAPALNLSGCGRSIQEAKESFQIVLREYILYTREHGTLEEDLIRHNWTKSSVMPKTVFTGLELDSSLFFNEQAKRITRGNFSKSNERISISC